MHKPPFRSDCCVQLTHLDSDVECFLPIVSKQIDRLCNKHAKMFTRRRRILEMACPRVYVPKFRPKCACLFAKTVTIVKDEVMQRTRTEQLSFPSVRKLLLFKKGVQHSFPDYRLGSLNRLIRKSLLSVYSRLHNVQPPEKRIPIHVWTPKEWRKHTRYLKKLAEAKKPKKVPREKREHAPIKSMKRFKKLAKPKKHIEPEKQDWVLTPDMKFYRPTERILKLAKHKAVDEDLLYQPVPTPVSPSAKTYKASKRIQEMSQAPVKRIGESDEKENPFAISPNALKAKASERTQLLAEPKEYENTHIRDNPNLISPAALKAKASPRTIELAKPKGS